MAETLLATKIQIPDRRPGLVSRPRLLQRLNAGLQSPLILVTAPAGFGKTTLLVDWIDTLKEKPATANDKGWDSNCDLVAWLTLHDSDNDPVRFWAYLFAALQAVQPDLARDAQSFWGQPASRTISKALASLINELSSLSRTVLLVLDDYHLIHEASIQEGLAFLLDHQPSNFHLVIASRADPNLPLARLRARGQLTELRLAELRFNREEAAAFLDKALHLELNDDFLAAISERTEGWAAGLQLAALALQNYPTPEDPTEFIRDFTGTNRYILDYLLEDVLERQPSRVLQFLLRTSILDQLSAGLCAALLPRRQDKPATSDRDGQASLKEAQDLLDILERENLFLVPLDHQRRWFRYHRLFADLLQKQLRQQAPDSVSHLHEQASLWYEQEGYPDEAIGHALSGQDYSRAADLIEQNAASVLARSQMVTLLNWVSRLPEVEREAHLDLCLYTLWSRVMTGRPIEPIWSDISDLDDALKVNAGVEPSGAAVAQVARLAVLKAFLRLQAGEIPPGGALEQLLDAIPPGDRFWRGFLLWAMLSVATIEAGLPERQRAMEQLVQIGRDSQNPMVLTIALSHLAENYFRQGQLHKAEVEFRNALAAAQDERGRKLPIAGEGLLGLAELYRERNRFEAAEPLYEEGLRLTEQWREAAALPGYISLALMRQAQGRMEDADAILRYAADLARRFDATEIDDLYVAFVQAEMSLVRGDHQPADQWIRHRNLEAALFDPLEEYSRRVLAEAHFLKYEILFLARYYLAVGRPEAALQALECVRRLIDGKNRGGFELKIALRAALALDAMGRREDAIEKLRWALDRGGAEGFVWSFLEEGPPMLDLLRATADRWPEGRFARRLLAEANALEPNAGREGRMADRSGMIEPLSEREMEVLRLLASSRSIPDIADELFVAVSTVRSHIKSIYAKLDVHSRYEAVDRAVELGLVS